MLVQNENTADNQFPQIVHDPAMRGGPPDTDLPVLQSAQAAPGSGTPMNLVLGIMTLVLALMLFIAIKFTTERPGLANLWPAGEAIPAAQPIEASDAESARLARLEDRLTVLEKMAGPLQGSYGRLTTEIQATKASGTETSIRLQSIEDRLLGLEAVAHPAPAQ